jgi:hypothetical protein
MQKIPKKYSGFVMTFKGDLNQFFAAAGSNYLTQVHNNRATSDTRSHIAGLRATDESVPGPLRDVQTVRHILR